MTTLIDDVDYHSNFSISDLALILCLTIPLTLGLICIGILLLRKCCYPRKKFWTCPTDNNIANTSDEGEPSINSPQFVSSNASNNGNYHPPQFYGFPTDHRQNDLDENHAMLNYPAHSDRHDVAEPYVPASQSLNSNTPDNSAHRRPRIYGRRSGRPNYLGPYPAVQHYRAYSEPTAPPVNASHPMNSDAPENYNNDPRLHQPSTGHSVSHEQNVRPYSTHPDNSHTRLVDDPNSNSGTLPTYLGDRGAPPTYQAAQSAAHGVRDGDVSPPPAYETLHFNSK